MGKTKKIVMSKKFPLGKILFPIYLVLLLVINIVFIKGFFEYDRIQSLWIVSLFLFDILTFIYFLFGFLHDLTYANKKFWTYDNLLIALISIPVLISYLISQTELIWNGNVSVETFRWEQRRVGRWC